MPDPKTKKPRWRDQDAALIAYWKAGLSDEIIAARLGRVVRAIVVRASKLGLPRRNKAGRKPVLRVRLEPSPILASPPASTLSASPYAGDATCLFQGPNCQGTFHSWDRRKNRKCPSCAESLAEAERAGSAVDDRMDAGLMAAGASLHDGDLPRSGLISRSR
jgi:hypothetical protein